MQTTHVTFLAGELPLAKCSKLHLFAFSGVVLRYASVKR